MSRQLSLSALLSSLMVLGFALASTQAPADSALTSGGVSALSVSAGY